MKNYIKLFGIIALVAIIGFSMIACDDGDGGVEKNLVIVGISGDLLNEGVHGYSVAIFPVGTSEKNVLADFMAGIMELDLDSINYAIAFYDDEYLTVMSSTLTVPLVDLKTWELWKGSGTYDVYLILYDVDTAHIYKAGNISITSASTAIAISKFTKVDTFDYSDYY